MESVQGNNVLQIPPTALCDIRKIHNLEPSMIKQAVNILQAWILKEDHITKKDFSEEYLEKTLICCKGSVEKSKKQIDRLCTMKTLLPKFFSKINIRKELQTILTITKLVPLPILTEDYYRIVFVKINDKELTNASFMQYFQFCINAAEYFKANDYCNGFIFIYDCRKVNMFEIISKLNTVELQQFLTILVEGYGARIKSIEMMTDSKAIELLITTVKQFVSEKIGGRMHVRRCLVDLHKVVPKELLPLEYGGIQKSLETLHEELMEELSSPEHIDYVTKMFNACSDETKRNAVKFNEEYLGMPGSFRRLNVD